MGRYESSYTGERRTVKRTLQLTPTEAAALDAGAEQRGITWSDFSRDLLLECSVARPARRTHLFPELAATKRQLEHSQHALNAAGNLLNQIARHANMSGQLSQEHLDVLKDALDLVKRAIEQYITGLQLLHSLGQ